MPVKYVASYWSATADIGRGHVAPKTGNGSASYWSATANIGKADTVSLSDTVINSTYYNRRRIPYVANRGDAGSAYRAQQMIADAGRQRSRSTLSVKLRLGDARALNNQDDFFARLKERLSALGKTLVGISTVNDFNPYKAVSSDTGAVEARADADATPGKHNVAVTRTAQNHQVASDQQIDPFAALNLSGTISVNGYSIQVTTSDSLADIRDKINYGEDTNHDHILNTTSEDINGNGTLDKFHRSGVYVGNGVYLPSYNYFEDINGDGVINASEDINNSKTLDGGTKQTQAAARIEDKRLIIKNLRGADTTVSLSDPNDILETLGFYKRNEMNVKLLKTSLDNAVGNDYIQDPQTALFTIDGVAHSANSNVVNNAIPGVTLTLKSVTSRDVAIKVSVDTGPALKNIEDFTNSFNSVIRQINIENLKHLQLQDNVRVQDLAIALARSAADEVGSISRHPRSLGDIGVKSEGSGRAAMDPAVLQALASDKTTEALKNTSGGQPGLMAMLNRIGITSGNDFTLTVDKAALAQAVANNPHGVYSVFNKEPDGVSNRIARQISRAISVPNGMIEYQRQVIRSYGKNPADSARIMSDQFAATITKSEITTAQALLEPVTV